MVTLTRIYTRGGDQGQTSLGDGSRVAKHALRVEAYGTVDEANATLGLVRLHSSGEHDAMLARVQNELFDLGADLCRPGSDFDNPKRLRVTDGQVERLEREIDAMNEGLAPLSSFVLPGGSAACAHLHLAPGRPPLPLRHGRAARRAAAHGAGRERARQPGSRALPQPPVRPPVR